MHNCPTDPLKLRQAWKPWGRQVLPVAQLPKMAPVHGSHQEADELLGESNVVSALADPEPGLSRVLPPIPELTRELWLISHKALRGTARVRAFMDVVGSG